MCIRDRIVSVRQQPLLLDYLYLYEPDMGIPKEKTNFFMTLKYGCLRFFSSFVNDYSTLSAAEGQSDITVWVGNGLSGGRDQAQALNQLILQTFSSNTGINVNLQLVPPNTVLTASIANKGPDIALQVSASDPVNYAMRGAAEEMCIRDRIWMKLITQQKVLRRQLLTESIFPLRIR